MGNILRAAPSSPRMTALRHWNLQGCECEWGLVSERHDMNHCLVVHLQAYVVVYGTFTSICCSVFTPYFSFWSHYSSVFVYVGMCLYEIRRRLLSTASECIHAYSCACMRIPFCVHVCAYVYMYMYMCMYMYMYVYMYMDVYILIFTYIYIYIYKSARTLAEIRFQRYPN